MINDDRKGGASAPQTTSRQIFFYPFLNGPIIIDIKEQEKMTIKANNTKIVRKYINSDFFLK